VSRAVFASDPGKSRGRLVPEAIAPERSEFQRDRERIIHSTAFRRLKDKTQVFLFDEGDHYRTRLTHTLEVAQIARAIARSLALDEDLAEALALAHDLGHPPFGHAGERALAAAVAGHGGFDHNAQSLRVVTLLEKRYPGFDGLNLTWETLEGLVKHNGPLLDADGKALSRYPNGLPPTILEYCARHDLQLSTHAGPEAQVAAIADDIAYDAHDIDDGLRAGLLTLERLEELSLVGSILRDIRRDYPELPPERVRAELVRRMIRVMIEDVVAESGRRLGVLAPASVEAIRKAAKPMVGFSVGVAAADEEIKTRLGNDLYRNPRVIEVMDNAEAVLRRLFERYRDDHDALPAAWRPQPGEDRLRVVADFLAGMTDRYALAEHERFFGAGADLR
jgi:dGTPase